MQEQLISFEVAKLAKEKGFKTPTLDYYFEDGEYRRNELTGTNGYYGEEYCFSFDEFLENWNDKWLTKKNGNRCFGCNKSKGYFETYSAPTQSLLQKWLREVHNIDLWVERYNENEMYIFQCPKLNLEKIFGYFKTYEEALEIGLLKGLKLIKNE